jgi:Protein of unknown function (DUF402)
VSCGLFVKRCGSWPRLDRTEATFAVMQIYDAGATIRRVEVPCGQVWLEQPVTVVSDDGVVLAIRLDPGSPFTFRDHPMAPHPWSVRTAWGSTVVLQLHRTGDDYAVWKVFGADGVFRNWYINFESPIVRRPDAFEIDDHGLDLIVYPDGTRKWKDVEDLHHERVRGRIDVDTVVRVLAAAAEVTDLLDSGTEWWRPWAEWQPDLY